MLLYPTSLANPDLARIACRVMAHLFAIGNLLGYYQGDDSAEVWKHWLGGPGAQSMLDGAGKAGQAGKQFFASEPEWAVEFLCLLHAGQQVHRALLGNVGGGLSGDAYH